MKKSLTLAFLALAFFASCKTSTNPEQGQTLHLISSNQDTSSVASGPVEFTLTVLDRSNYGVGGAYIDFYDPIQLRQRHEGPTPADGTISIFDTIAASSGGGSFAFSFVATYSGATSSTALEKWVQSVDIRPWAIDSLGVNSYSWGEIGVQWKRPAEDMGTDTVIVLMESSLETFLAPYPQNSLVFTSEAGLVDSISVHNLYNSSRTLAWAATETYQDINLYERGDSNYDSYSGFLLSDGEVLPVTSTDGDGTLVDLILATDPANGGSGASLISPSMSSLTGIFGGKVTRLYHPVQFIDSTGGLGLRELYYTEDISQIIKNESPTFSIPLPDSSKYSTAFIVVTQDKHYAQVCVRPVTHDWQGHLTATVSVSYQPD
ncbi:MAG TPA: hypothetical protein VGM92_03340, partial [Candidatus Kapabacteria bacterium]